MFNGLLKLLGNAGHTIGQDVSHPQNILNNLANLVPHGTPQPAQPASRSPLPASLSPQVTSAPNVWGTLAVQHAADQQGYAPWFRSLVQGTNPTVGALADPRAGADYLPGANKIQLRPAQLDPYTITHEGLHAAFDRKTPAAQAAFAKVAAQATPDQQDALSSLSQLGNPIYGGRHPLTEVHSFLPQFNSGPSPTDAYYNHYFSNPDFYHQLSNSDYYGIQGQANHAVQYATGFNGAKPGYPLPPQKFSDWQNN